jgi:hypothetical protein
MHISSDNNLTRLDWPHDNIASRVATSFACVPALTVFQATQRQVGTLLFWWARRPSVRWAKRTDTHLTRMEVSYQ